MRLSALILLLGVLGATAAVAQTVDYLELGESQDRTDGVPDAAFFSVVLEGSGIFNAALATPGGLPVPLFATSSGVFETLIPFETAADRQSRFPSGNYELFVNGGSVGSVSFNPTVPNGFAPIHSPSDGATGVALDPTFSFSNECTNCITTSSGLSGPADLELGVFTEFTGAIDEVAFVDPTSTSFRFGIPLVAAELHGFYTAAFANDIDFSPGFEYEQYSEEVNFIEFVPGIGGVLSGICGDLDFNFILSTEDANRFRNALADPVGSGLSAAEQARCGVIGGPAPCDIRQVAVMLRTLNDESSLPGIAAVCADAPPSSLGVYTGSVTETRFGCLDPDNDETIMAPIAIAITSQDAYGSFEGSSTASLEGFTDVTLLSGFVASDGSIQAGGIAEIAFQGSFLSKSVSGLTGSLVGNTLSLEGDGFDVLGDICSFITDVAATR
jgi:hypothetical protein